MGIREECEKRERDFRLQLEVLKEFYDCGDDAVMMYFDPDSEKDLEKKYRVLKAINAGKSVSDADFFSILEKLPHDEAGRPLVSDW